MDLEPRSRCFVRVRTMHATESMVLPCEYSLPFAACYGIFTQGRTLRFPSAHANYARE